MTVKAKIALKEIIKRNRAVFVSIGIFTFLFLIISVDVYKRQPLIFTTHQTPEAATAPMG